MDNAKERSFKKFKSQKAEFSSQKIEDGNSKTFQSKHDTRCVPPRETNLENFIVNWMSMDDKKTISKVKRKKVKAIFEELFSASTESTSLITEWALTELIRNQEAMQKVRDELAKGVAGDTVRESDLPQLPYLEACVKETLRLHPPAPLLLPHRAVQTCQVMGYTVPEDSQVLVNIWAIGRDPTLWNDPSNFKPERFLKSNLGLGYMGKDFEYLPFGSGRRMCPGQPLALRMLPLILASLLHHFDWVLPIPTNVAGLAEMDMTDKLDMTLQKEEKLRIIPKLRRHYY